MKCLNTSEARYKLIFGIGILAGVLAVLIGVGTPLVLTFPFDDIFHKQVENWIIIDSKGSDRYTDWANYYSYTNPYYVSFYFWNLTNPQDVLNRTMGVKPTYTSVGPYIYRRYRIKRNVAFLADGESVQYRDEQWFVWNANMSQGNLETDLITNVNPAYVRIMHFTGGEYRMQLAISGTELNQIISFMNSTFVTDYAANAYGEVLNVAVPALLSELNASLGHMDTAETFFYSFWANATAPPPVAANWDGMLLWQGDPSLHPSPRNLLYPSRISMNSTRRLFDPAVPNSFMNSTDASNGGPWSDARTSVETQQMLMEQFNISTEQLHTILFWLSQSFNYFKTTPYITSKFSVQNITDVAYVQWGSARPLKGRSIKDLYPARFVRGAPELPFQPHVPSPVGTGEIPYENAKTFLSGPFGVTVPENVLYEFTQPKPNFTRWGFPANETSGPDTVVSYIVNFVAVNYTLPDLNHSLASGGGIITTRSVHDMLWSCRDPTMELVMPSYNCSLFRNDTLSSANIVDNGSNNITAIEQYKMWHNETIIVDVWAKPIHVRGSSKSGQFQPFLKDTTPVSYWEGALLRTLSLHKVGELKNQYDISVWKYQYAADVFKNSTQFTETVDGFANMTQWHPMGMYYSNWDMFGVPPQNSTSLVNGLNPTTADNDSTTVQIEPITGIGTAEKWFYMYNPLFADGVFYPTLKYEDSVYLNSDQAQDFKDRITLLLWYQKFFFWFSIALGCVLAGVFVVATSVGGGCLWKISREKAGYDRVFYTGVNSGTLEGHSPNLPSRYYHDNHPYPRQVVPPSTYIDSRASDRLTLYINSDGDLSE